MCISKKEIIDKLDQLISKNVIISRPSNETKFFRVIHKSFFYDKNNNMTKVIHSNKNGDSVE